MSIAVAIVILFEAILALVTVYGFLHEDRVIAWERRVGREFRRRLCEKWLNRGDLEAVRIYKRG